MLVALIDQTVVDQTVVHNMINSLNLSDFHNHALASSLYPYFQKPDYIYFFIDVNQLIIT